MSTSTLAKRITRKPGQFGYKGITRTSDIDNGLMVNGTHVQYRAVNPIRNPKPVKSPERGYAQSFNTKGKRANKARPLVLKRTFGK